MAMHIYLAGTEAQITEELLARRGIHRGFASFLYVKKYKEAGLHRLRLLRESAQSVIIDSGAHTFFSQHEFIASAHIAKQHRKNKKKAESPDEYMEGYFEFLQEHGPMFDYFVELDIGEIVGQRQVYRWRERFAKLGLLEKCVIVYHPAVESLRHFLASMREWPSRYVALQGYRNGKPTMDYVRVLKHCYDAGVRAHGFAMTKPEVLESIPFYSVDSSTYLAGAKYGRITLRHSPVKFVGERFGKPPNDSHKNRMARVAIANEVPLDLIERYRSPDTSKRTEVRTEVLRLAARAYEQMEEFYTRFWLARGVDWEAQVRADA